jgi:RsiW-degrading membrane proteinase PrsW (M82 family)
MWVAVLFCVSRVFSKLSSGTILGLAFVGTVVGLIIFISAGVLEINWPTLTSVSLTHYQGSVIVFPIIEEVLKLSGIFLTVRALQLTRIFSHELSAAKVFVLGASVGLGFAFFETLGIQNALTVVLRGIWTWPMHMCTSTILSSNIIILRMPKPRQVSMVLLVFLAAVLVHSLFNYSVLSLHFS